MLFTDRSLSVLLAAANRMPTAPRQKGALATETYSLEEDTYGKDT